MASKMNILREWILKKMDIVEKDNKLYCNDEFIDLDERSYYFQKRGKDETDYSMRAIYFYISSTGSSFTDYLSFCNSKNLPKIIYLDSRPLKDWFSGVTNELEGLKEPEYAIKQKSQQIEATPAPVVEKVIEEPKESVVVAPVPVYKQYPEVEYEVLRGIDSVLLGPVDFSRMMIVNSQIGTNTQQVKDTKSYKYANPVIIVPQTDQCCINNSNIERFLDEGVWTKPNDQRLDIEFEIQHISYTTQKKMKFQVVSDPSLLFENDWDKVVAIFVSGHHWQFRQSIIKDIAKLFARCPGIYVQYEGDNTPQFVQSYNIKVFKIGKFARHLDSQVSTNIWYDIEEQYSIYKRRNN